MASVVMKAVQVQHPAVSPTSMPCAGKLGDDADLAKAQVGLVRFWNALQVKLDMHAL